MIISRFIIIFCLVSVIITNQSYRAQNKYDFNQFWNETKEFVKQPGKWDKNDWLTVAAVTGGTLAIMAFDETIRDFSQDRNEYAYSIVPEGGRIWGEPYFTGILAGVFLLHGSLADNNANKKLGFEIAQSFVYTSLTVGIMKFSFGRARPYTGSTAFTYKPFYFKGNSYWSFPSGHTSTAFSLSTVIASNFDKTFLKVLSFIPAFVAAASRVYQNHHWTSDVFMGGMIGYFIGRFVTDLHKKNETEQVKPKELITFSFAF